MKIGMIGSFNYSNQTRIKEMLNTLRDSLDTELVVLSGGGKLGAERAVRKFCLEFNIKYVEFNPACTPCNGYSAMPPAFYDKPKHGSHFIHRYMMLSSSADKLLVFANKDEDISFFNSAINKMKKRNKKVVIVN